MGTFFWRRKGEVKTIWSLWETDTKKKKKHSVQFQENSTFIRIVFPKLECTASWFSEFSATQYLKYHWRTIWDCREIKVSNNLGIISNKQMIQPDDRKTCQPYMYGLTLHLFCHRKKAIIKFWLLLYQSNWLCSGWLRANFRVTY